MEKKTITSWGQLIIVATILMMFVIGLAQVVNMEEKNDYKDFVFNDNCLMNYVGSEEVISIPDSYSLGKGKIKSGTVVFYERYEAFDFLQENFFAGQDGYYEFYNQIYEHSYPWTYDYEILMPTYKKGNDFKVNIIGSSAFENCVSIKKVIIPSSITSINLFAFQHCSSLGEVVFNEGLIEIGDSSFWGTAVQHVVLPESLEYIQPYAFFGANKLEDVVIKKNVKSISLGVFNGCENLKTVSIKNLNEIQSTSTSYYQTFSRCPKLNSIFVPETMLNYYKTTSPWNLYSDKYKILKERV